MNAEEFRKNGYKTIDWIADYLENIEKYPVKSNVKPGKIFEKFEDTAPNLPDSFDELINDLNQKILPGITHWQHPHFHAYFNANNSYPSILAEAITAGIGAQCMIWETSPSAAELEEKIMEWFKEMMNLPSTWSGVIQDTASTATLAAILSAREWKSDNIINQNGFNNHKFRVYCSSQTHSSIEKGVKIAGFGSQNLVKIDVNPDLSMNTEALENAIISDIEKDYTPCIIISTQGTTGTLAMDDVKKIGDISKRFNVWHHVDAAYAGNAFILPEFHNYTEGYENADSFVFNPHKWMFTNFDCSVYFVKNKDLLLNTFEILPEYLKTGTRGKVNDYRDWGIPLGRRFRALKLWFVIRTYGVSGLRDKIRSHIDFAKWLADQIEKHDTFQVMAPRNLNMVVCRYEPQNVSEKNINSINQSLLESINQSGEAYLSHTKIGDKYVIRINLGGTYMEKHHVENIWEILKKHAKLITVSN